MSLSTTLSRDWASAIGLYLPEEPFSVKKTKNSFQVPGKSPEK